MLKQLTFHEDFRGFKAGTTIKFRPGVNLLVGDQGTGKSSLLQAIAAAGNVTDYGFSRDLKKKVSCEASPIDVFGLDFEKHNKRTLGYLDYDILEFQISAKLSSHGEQNLALLKLLETAENKLIFLDEPDMALSLRSILKLVNLFKAAVKRGCQIIAAVHHPFLIEAWKEVYSCEHDTWMTSKDFMQSQINEI
jgi:predicted ATPase